MSQSNVNGGGDVNVAEWKLEAYRVAFERYKHEDAQFMKTLSTFTGLQAGLMAFSVSDYVTDDSFMRYIIPLFGICLCVPWAFGMRRLMLLTDYLEGKVDEIEKAIHKPEGNEEQSRFRVNDRDGFRMFAATKGLFADVRWSHLMIAIPIVSSLIWVLLGGLYLLEKGQAF